jgi:hypothetical protein
MALPYVGTRRIGRSAVTPVRCSRFIDLIDGEEPWRALIGRADRPEKLISHGAARVPALGHLGHMDVGVEVIEDNEVRLRRVHRGIDAQKIDGVGSSHDGTGLGHPSVQQ